MTTMGPEPNAFDTACDPTSLGRWPTPDDVWRATREIAGAGATDPGAVAPQPAEIRPAATRPDLDGYRAYQCEAYAERPPLGGAITEAWLAEWDRAAAEARDAMLVEPAAPGAHTVFLVGTTEGEQDGAPPPAALAALNEGLARWPAERVAQYEAAFGRKPGPMKFVLRESFPAVVKVSNPIADAVAMAQRIPGDKMWVEDYEYHGSSCQLTPSAKEALRVLSLASGVVRREQVQDGFFAEEELAVLGWKKDRDTDDWVSPLLFRETERRMHLEREVVYLQRRADPTPIVVDHGNYREIMAVVDRVAAERIREMMEKPTEITAIQPAPMSDAMRAALNDMALFQQQANALSAAPRVLGVDGHGLNREPGDSR